MILIGADTLCHLHWCLSTGVFLCSVHIKHKYKVNIFHQCFYYNCMIVENESDVSYKMLSRALLDCWEARTHDENAQSSQSSWNADTIMKILAGFYPPEKHHLHFTTWPEHYLSVFGENKPSTIAKYNYTNIYEFILNNYKYYNSETTVQFQVELHLWSMTTIPPLMSLQGLHCANMERRSNPRNRVRFPDCDPNILFGELCLSSQLLYYCLAFCWKLQQTLLNHFLVKLMLHNLNNFL